MPLPCYLTSKVNFFTAVCVSSVHFGPCPSLAADLSSSAPVTWAPRSQQANSCHFLFVTAILCPGTLCRVVRHCLHNPLILSPRVLRAPPRLVINALGVPLGKLLLRFLTFSFLTSHILVLDVLIFHSLVVQCIFSAHPPLPLCVFILCVL